MTETNDTEQTQATPATETSAAAAQEAQPEPSSSGEANASAVAEDPGAEARAEAERLKDLWMRTAAEFDNYRKRSRREVDDARRSGREDLLRELLPIFDNLERAIQSAQSAPDVKAVCDGLTMILKQFTDTLGRSGITRVPGVGAPFDPTVHEAIQQVQSSEHPAGSVIAEVQPGYIHGDRLVRAAMVVVAAPGSGPSESN